MRFMTVPPPHQPPPEDPHEGSEDDPRRELDPMDEQPVVPPRRYASSDVDRPAEGTVVEATPPTTMDRIIAVSWPLSIAAFMVLGFTTGMWYIVWLVILIPWALSAWRNPNED